MLSMVEASVAGLPADAPRYLMGIGEPADLVEAVARGIDMFDCVVPTRNARNGSLFTACGVLHIKNTRYASDSDPVDAECECLACRNYSRAYLRHLFLSRELSVYRLISIHNIFFYQKLMERMREAISRGTFEEFRRRFYERWHGDARQGEEGPFGGTQRCDAACEALNISMDEEG